MGFVAARARSPSECAVSLDRPSERAKADVAALGRARAKAQRMERIAVKTLLISPLPHVRSWVRDAVQVIERDGAILLERHGDAGIGLLRACDDIDLVLLDLDAPGLGAVDVDR